MKSWQRVVGTVVLTVAGVHGFDVAMKKAPLPAPASHFFQYFEALEETGKTDFLERVLYSWIMAGSQTESGSQPVS